jgi:hypothetical protein
MGVVLPPPKLLKKLETEQSKPIQKTLNLHEGTIMMRMTVVLILTHSS